jgi:hypothetical protein
VYALYFLLDSMITVVGAILLLRRAPKWMIWLSLSIWGAAYFFTGGVVRHYASMIDLVLLIVGAAVGFGVGFCHIAPHSSTLGKAAATATRTL